MNIRLALVPGEPAGVGPELVVRLAQRLFQGALVALCDPDLLLASARQLALPLTLAEVTDTFPSHKPGHLSFIPLPLEVPVLPGQPDPANADSVVAALRLAAEGCLTGRFNAMVTGPVQKSTLAEGGYVFHGTTEFLAQLAGGCEVVMMLANPTLRVALVTTHLPLRAVADAITAQRVRRALEILHAALIRDFGIKQPRIAVLGLNPHAGEAGHLGREEIEVIAPTLEELRARGMQLVGPLPADTAFLPARLAHCDAVLAMYHDQGLPVLKHAGFENAVNITLGLPFIRVAVDHGTALDIAGSGCADPSSLMTAVETAAIMARRRAAEVSATRSPGQT